MQSVLDELPAADVKVYVVWEPIRLWDRRSSADHDRALVPDRSALHFWARNLELAKAFQKPIGLATEPAWDVYLLYPAGTRWSEGHAPTPSEFMHQLPGRLPDANMLDERGLARRLSHVIGDSPATVQRE